jgi:excisionase family DNA binding protein
MDIRYLTVEEIAEQLHMSPGTVRNRLSRKELMPPSVRVGRRRLFPVVEFNNWIIDLMQNGQGPSSTPVPGRGRGRPTKAEQMGRSHRPK